VFRQFGGVSGVATNLWRIDAAGPISSSSRSALNESDPECSLDGKWSTTWIAPINRYFERIFLEGGLAETVIYAPTVFTHSLRRRETIVK